MSVRHLLAAAAAAALLGVLVLATPASAHVLAQSADPSSYGMTAGRFLGTSAALLGLVGAVVGGLALARSVRRTGNGGQKGATVALASGLIAIVGGTLNLAVADGGAGTGNGVVGAAAALALGLVATTLGGLARTRSRRDDTRTTAGSRP